MHIYYKTYFAINLEIKRVKSGGNPNQGYFPSNSTIFLDVSDSFCTKCSVLPFRKCLSPPCSQTYFRLSFSPKSPRTICRPCLPRGGGNRRRPPLPLVNRVISLFHLTLMLLSIVTLRLYWVKGVKVSKNIGKKCSVPGHFGCLRET